MSKSRVVYNGKCKDTNLQKSAILEDLKEQNNQITDTLISDNEKDKQELTKLIMNSVPDNGKKIGNTAIIRKLQENFNGRLESSIIESEYWVIRNSLIEQGIIQKARGKGGSVFKLTKTTEKMEENSASYNKESGLYKPFMDTLEKKFTKDQSILEYVLQLTAMQGARQTGGKWTRPDLSMVAISKYTYLPGKYIDVITFEIKHLNNFDITGVYEAAAHTSFANKSYLSIQTSDELEESETATFDRIKVECRRFGIGLIVFNNPAEYDTWEILVDAERHNPDYAATDFFIGSQFDEKKRVNIISMLK
ncbi:MAG: hypothetical protein F6K36_28035 [Symploca sp. SIO3C6]|nr:hypothetical protein [Symploca sp. SIO3C6]